MVVTSNIPRFNLSEKKEVLIDYEKHKKYWKTGTRCYGLKVYILPNSYVKAINPGVTAFRDGVFKEVIQIKMRS